MCGINECLRIKVLSASLVNCCFLDSCFLKVAGKYWKTGIGEFYRSFSKSAFTRALQELIPEITESDLIEVGLAARIPDNSKGTVLLFAPILHSSLHLLLL